MKCLNKKYGNKYNCKEICGGNLVKLFNYVENQKKNIEDK